MPAQKINQESTLKNQKTVGLESELVRPEPIKVLLGWTAPERFFKKRSREYFTTIGAMVFLLVVILLFLQEWLLIIVVVALTFVAYVMATIEPGQVEYKITNRGLVIGEKTYLWSVLGRFWFTQKWSQKALQVENFSGFPQRLLLLLGEASQESIKNLLSPHLNFEEPERTWTDKASEWLAGRVPLEKTD